MIEYLEPNSNPNHEENISRKSRDTLPLCLSLVCKEKSAFLYVSLHYSFLNRQFGIFMYDCFHKSQALSITRTQECAIIVPVNVLYCTNTWSGRKYSMVDSQLTWFRLSYLCMQQLGSTAGNLVLVYIQPRLALCNPSFRNLVQSDLL